MIPQNREARARMMAQFKKSNLVNQLMVLGLNVLIYSICIQGENINSKSVITQFLSSCTFLFQEVDLVNFTFQLQSCPSTICATMDWVDGILKILMKNNVFDFKNLIGVGKLLL